MIRDRRTQYARGADFERKVRDELMHDYEAVYVTRSAGSRGIVDLVAFFQATDLQIEVEENEYEMVASPEVWLVQCKRDGRINDEDRELLLSLAAETGCTPVLAFPVMTAANKIVVEFKVLRDAE